jgi:hypothetical protein
MLDNIAPLIRILVGPSGKWKTAQDLQNAIAAIANSAKNQSISNEPDPDFVVGPIDWNKLAAGGDPAFQNEISQSLRHDCLLNAVRFVLQKRYNVMIGQNQQGDRIVFSLIANAYYKVAEFEQDFQQGGVIPNPREFNLWKGQEWLNALGIVTFDPVQIENIAGYIAQNPGSARIFLVAGDYTGADHTYVLHDFRTAAGRLEAKVYDPWNGKNLLQPVGTGPGTDWYDVGDFQVNVAMPVQADGTKIKRLGPGGSSDDNFLHPGDPELPSHRPIYYSVLFASIASN